MQQEEDYLVNWQSSTLGPKDPWKHSQLIMLCHAWGKKNKKKTPACAAAWKWKTLLLGWFMFGLFHVGEKSTVVYKFRKTSTSHANRWYSWPACVVGLDFTVYIQPVNGSGGTPQGIWSSEAARNILLLYPCMDLCKLILSSRHMPTPQDHKCLGDRDSKISLPHQPSQSPALHWAFAGMTWYKLLQMRAAEHQRGPSRDSLTQKQRFNKAMLLLQLTGDPASV